MIKRSQSIVEFVALFMIVALAIMMTYKYLNRSVNARLKNVQEELEYKNY